MEKKKKKWARPRLEEVKLNIEEAVLTPCKAADVDTAGKNGRGCMVNACRLTLGT